jgi:hypothetical protein
MARFRLWVLLAVAGSALPAAAEPPRDALHPGDAEVWQVPDPAGLSALLDHRNRTPSGLLYPYPWKPFELSDLGGGWSGRGALEAGYFWVTGDSEETRFNRYTQRKTGPLLDLLDLELWKPESGDYFMLRSGSVGRHDQFYDLEADRAGWIRFRGWFSGVPHNYAKDAISLYNGSRADVLTLPGSLTAGASTPDQIAAAFDDRGKGTVDVQRNRTQLQLKVRALPELALVAQYGLEDRRGDIPSGVGFAFPDFSTSISQNMEITYPVDDQTQSASARLEYGGDLVQANLAWNGSFYRDRETSTTIEQPFDSFGLIPITAARLSNPPDNDWNNVRADVAVNMPLRSRLTSVFSWTRSTQNDDLLPPTIQNGTIGTTNLADWNTTSALSEQSAHARVDQTLVDINLYLNPWRPLRVRGGVRYLDRKTKTDYIAHNPITNQYGYIVEDAGWAAVTGPSYLGFFQPSVPGSSWRWRNMPFGESRLTWDLGATVQVPWRTSFDVLLKQLDINRDVSERTQNTERSVTASVNSRALSFATARVSYTYLTRDGNAIDYNTYSQYETSSFRGFIPQFPNGDPAWNLQQMVRSDVADLKAQRWNARLILNLGDHSDLNVTGRLRSDDYGSDYGTRSDRMRDAEAEWTVQPSPEVSASAFFSLAKNQRNSGSIRGFASSPNPNAGGPNFPFANEWAADAHGQAVGWGGRFTLSPLEWLQVDTRYTFLVTRENDDVAFASAAALAAPDSTSTKPVPTDFPKLRTRDQAVETSLRIALRKSVGFKLYYRYARSEIDDYHQTGLTTLIGRRVYLAHQDLAYAATFFGATVQFSFGSGW